MAVLSVIPSPRQLAVALILSTFSSAGRVPLQQPLDDSQTPISIGQTCPNPSWSCPGRDSDVDTCCVNAPAGIFALAQFWDTHPIKGRKSSPPDAWTLHGLWPDYCEGERDGHQCGGRSNFPCSCNEERELGAGAIAQAVQQASSSSHPGMYEYMTTYWKGLKGDADLWSHEWNKHGTCVTTLDPKCYGSSTTDVQNHVDLIDYFSATIALHSSLNTYKVLEAINIVPDEEKEYPLDDILSALKGAHGGNAVTVRCRNGALSELWQHYNVRGSLRGSNMKDVDRFRPVAPDSKGGNCPEMVRYPPKPQGPSPGPRPTPRPKPSPGPGPSPNPFKGRGHLRVNVLSDSSDATIEAGNDGCLIGVGAWYTSGDCATFRAKSDANEVSGLADAFTLSSSKGPCGIVDGGEFKCDRNLGVQTIFGSEGGSLSYKNSASFYAEHKPKNFQKEGVYVSSGSGDRPVKLELVWESV